MFPGDCGDIEEARIAEVSESADALEVGGGGGGGGGRAGGCMVPH